MDQRTVRNGSLPPLEEDADQLDKEENNNIDDQSVDSEQQSVQTNFFDTVLYPIAPTVKQQSDDQVDVTVSPAFQTLDQVRSFVLTIYSM